MPGIAPMPDSKPIAPPNSAERPSARLMLVRAISVAVGLMLWFGTQAMLGARAFPPGVSEYDLGEAARVLLAGDALLAGTAKWNDWLAANDAAANALLVASSLIIDALGIFLLAWAIFGPSLRPFVGLLCLFALRQACQVMSALPAPPGMIWHDPGFPSLLVTYHVANDFFFSGHTALAVFGAVELGRLNRRKLAVVAATVAVFQMTAVLVLRAHWTLDVFTGAVAAMYVSRTLRWLGPWCDDRLDLLVRRRGSTVLH
ncbi:MAG: hypothetical protein DCC68_02510 [Planctomycetota bacterium]|nr:MAG: hypothetical protein DCC68_02510 [Planctomycetota bacterium]